MKYSVTVDSYPLSPEQKTLAANLKISEDFLRLLLSRGHKEEELKAFLYPRPEDMFPPLAIEGMQAAAERITRALSQREKILIFGDYDCDGISAISILTLYLRDKTDVFYFIPDRNKHGYGMTVDALKGIVSARRPDLVITVDCGITSKAEVEYLKSQKIDVIVTDHHEPQSELPDCIIVDPKIKRSGYCEYCGAGVAFKLVEALGGLREAEKYLDIAAIATIADVVPLTGDNRIIAYYGLKAILSSPRKGIKMLLGSDNVTSQDVMFRLAPRINAAGRLNSAMKVVDLFLETDYFMLRSLSEELERDNSKRQEICESVVREAKQMLVGADFNSMGIIVLASENWEAGVLGIAAARLVDEFKRPAVLFSSDKNELKGSARSVKEINIFSLFSKFSEFFIAFGGHSQAAGVSMCADKLDAFRQAVNSEVLSSYPISTFMPGICCEMELDLSKNVEAFAKELELLEPTGYANPKPNFLLRAQNLCFERIGFSNHIKCSTPKLDVIGFSKFGFCMSATRGKVDLELTLGLNVFQNRVYVQGIIQSLQSAEICIPAGESSIMCLHHLDYEGDFELEETDEKQISSFLEKPFGTLFVCFCEQEYRALASAVPKVRDLPVLVSTPRCLNPENSVIITPAPNYDFSFYSNVIVAGRPMSQGYLGHVKGDLNKIKMQNGYNSVECGSKTSPQRNTYAFGDCSAAAPSVSDETMRAVFRELRCLSQKRERVQNAAKLYNSVSSKIKISPVEFFIVLRIFDELGLLSINDRGNIEVFNKRTELKNSAVYRNIRKYEQSACQT